MGVLGLVVVTLILGKLEPVRHGHGAEVGESPEIAGTVHGIDTAGLGGAQRQVVVGPEKLDGGELLEGHLSPVLVEVQNRKLGLLTRFEGEREVGFGVGGIAGVEDRLLVLALEVLVDHDGNGQEHIVLVQKNGVLAAAARGVGVNVDVAVIGGIHRNGGGVVAVPLVEEGLVEACAADGEFVSTAQSIVARVAVAAEGLQRMALDLGLLQEGGEIMALVGVEAVTHVEVIGGGVGIGLHDTALGAGCLGNGVDPVSKAYLQLTAVLVGEKDKADNTYVLDIEAYVFHRSEIHAVERAVGSVGILYDQLIHGIGGEVRNVAHARDPLDMLRRYEVKHLIHLVGVGVECTVQQNGGSRGVQLDCLDVLDLYLLACIADVEAQSGHHVRIVGNGIEHHGVGVPLAVGLQIKAYLLIGIVPCSRSCDEVEVALGSGGLDRELHRVVFRGREAKAFLFLVVRCVYVRIVARSGVGDHAVLDLKIDHLIALDGSLVDGKGHFLHDGRAAHEVLSHDMGIVVVVAHAVDVGLGGGGGLGGQIGLTVGHGDENVHGVLQIGLTLGVFQRRHQITARGGQGVFQAHAPVFNAVSRPLGVGVVGLYPVGQTVGEHDGVGVRASQSRLNYGFILLFRVILGPVRSGIGGRCGYVGELFRGVGISTASATGGQSPAQGHGQAESQNEQAFEFHSISFLSAANSADYLTLYST